MTEAKRALKWAAGSDNLTPAAWLHQWSTQSEQKARSERLAVDQFLLAALDRPSKFRARWQETERRDADEALRTKWLQELEALLEGTRTPWERYWRASLVTRTCVRRPSFTYAGEKFPSRRAFHGVCKWCARAEGAQEPDDHSSDTVTSSNTKEGG